MGTNIANKQRKNKVNRKNIPYLLLYPAYFFVVLVTIVMWLVHLHRHAQR